MWVPKKYKPIIAQSSALPFIPVAHVHTRVLLLCDNKYREKWIKLLSTSAHEFFMDIINENTLNLFPPPSNLLSLVPRNEVLLRRRSSVVCSDLSSVSDFLLIPTHNHPITTLESNTFIPCCFREVKGRQNNK